MPTVKGVPEGLRTVTPHLICRDAAKAIEFYKKALGAVEISRSPIPDGSGRLIHSHIRVGDSALFIVDEFPEFGAKGPQSYGGSPVSIHLYVEDADAAFNRAVAAGAKAAMPLMDMFWGDRYGKFEDPFGHHWSVATKVRDVSPEEMAKGAAAAFSRKPC